MKLFIQEVFLFKIIKTIIPHKSFKIPSHSIKTFFSLCLYNKKNYFKVKMRKVIYPGTFDPVTYGHIDIIKRAIDLFDSVAVTVAINPTKEPLFSLKIRVDMLKESLKGYENVTVESFDGLVVDYARKVKAIGIIRGLRALSDFEYEFQMALMNRKLASNIATIFLMPHEKYTYLNSSIIRNLASLKSDVSEFVPPNVHKVLIEKFSK